MQDQKSQTDVGEHQAPPVLTGLKSISGSYGLTYLPVENVRKTLLITSPIWAEVSNGNPKAATR